MESTNSTRANLKKYIKVGGKWRFVPVLKQNGVPYPGTVLIDGNPVRSTSGTFYLEFYENGRRIQRPVGTSPREAKDAWNLRCSGEQNSADMAEDENLPPELTSISVAIERFLEEVKATRSIETYKAYMADLAWFAEKVGKQFVGQVTRHDILGVMGKGRDEALNSKTITRRLIVALMALRNAGGVIDLKRGDWPKTTDKTIEIYQKREMERFFRACTPVERLIFQVFLCSGFRKREVSTLTWKDVDFQQRTLRVRAKPEYRFKPKNHEERNVPVPASLIRSLASRRRVQAGSDLIFPTPLHPKRPHYGGDKPDAHHLELCKGIAWRARLNCRQCSTRIGKCSTGPCCERWTLHKWRHTFATNMLQSGIDLKSLQVVLGRKNLATTEKYLRALGLAGIRKKVDRSTIAALIGKRK